MADAEAGLSLWLLPLWQPGRALAYQYEQNLLNILNVNKDVTYVPVSGFILIIPIVSQSPLMTNPQINGKVLYCIPMPVSELQPRLQARAASPSADAKFRWS